MFKVSYPYIVIYVEIEIQLNFMSRYINRQKLSEIICA